MKKHPLISQEEKSVKIVLAFERKQGRKPIDVSKKHIGYDVRSSGRLIEVKSKPANVLPPFILLHDALLRKLGKDIGKYYVYVVWNMGNKPKLTVIPPDVIFHNLETSVKLFIRQRVFNKIKHIRL